MSSENYGLHLKANKGTVAFYYTEKYSSGVTEMSFFCGRVIIPDILRSLLLDGLSDDEVKPII